MPDHSLGGKRVDFFASQIWLAGLVSQPLWNIPHLISTARREFLRFLAASPYVAALGGVAAFMKEGAFAAGRAGAGRRDCEPGRRA